jgi:hypothetical protein
MTDTGRTVIGEVHKGMLPASLQPIATFMDTTAILAGVGLFTTLVGALGAPRLAASSQRSLNRLEERRRVLDEAAICLNKSEALARRHGGSCSACRRCQTIARSRICLLTLRPTLTSLSGTPMLTSLSGTRTRRERPSNSSPRICPKSEQHPCD